MTGQKGVTLWFTGLSGSGKTTVALEVERSLKEMGLKVERLDGDLVREYLTRDLGFSREDRDENIRRVSFVAKLLTKHGVIVLCSFISPYRQARQEVRDLIGSFAEVYVNAPLEVCEERDVKGLYHKARAGEIPEFTGVSDPYEPPQEAELELRTDLESVEQSAKKVISYLEQAGFIEEGFADLHLHSTFSDGVLSPRAVEEKAKEEGFRAVALTDHDTVKGIKKAEQAGKELNIEVIPGVELSALDESGENEKEVHIVGYFIDPDDEKLGDILARIVDDRENRAFKMIEKLNHLGLDIDLNRVKEIAGSKYLGRPHIAREMLEKGYINEMAEAFTTDYIGRDGRAYVERFKISPQEAIELIRQAGGVAVLAHPGYLSDRTSLAEEDIVKYQELGLQGVEVFYSRHSEEQVEYYWKIAEKLGLMITGGSDCHGGEAPLLGTVKLSYQYVEALKDARG